MHKNYKGSHTKCEVLFMIYVIAIVGGILGGLFGAGSGLIILPAMVSILKIDEYKARGTTLALTMIITIISSFFYYENNYFDFKIAPYIIVGGIIGGFVGAKIMHRIPKFWLSLSFYLFMIFIAIRMII